MNIEILGVYHRNKGALLMLEAILDRLRAEFPGARFAVPLSTPVETRLAYGLYATPAHDAYRLDAAGLAGYVPARLRRRFGLLAASEVDVVLDASGFGYGDYWGLRKLERRLAAPLARWKRPGRAAVLLPQALGPFDRPGMADAFRKAVGALDLVFVRDRQSLEHVRKVVGDDPRVRLAPDFTNLLHPALPERLRDVAGSALVIPNEKMISGQSEERRADYLGFLREAVAAIRASGREATLLIHEGVGDRRIAAELNALLDRPVPLIDEPSPLVTKAVIGAAELIVSSRFHGLVSALSAGVPALACGWSHKYQELMGDYGCPQFAFALGGDEAGPALNAFLKTAAQPGFRAKLGEHATAERARAEATWEQVVELIRAAGPGSRSR